MTFTRKNALAWCRLHVDEHREHGEVNTTLLAENCCDEFGVKDLGGPLDDETHWIWDVVQEVE